MILELLIIFAVVILSIPVVVVSGCAAIGYGRRAIRKREYNEMLERIKDRELALGMDDETVLCKWMALLVNEKVLLRARYALPVAQSVLNKRISELRAALGFIRKNRFPVLVCRKCGWENPGTAMICTRCSHLDLCSYREYTGNPNDVEILEDHMGNVVGFYDHVSAFAASVPLPRPDGVFAGCTTSFPNEPKPYKPPEQDPKPPKSNSPWSHNIRSVHHNYHHSMALVTYDNGTKQMVSQQEIDAGLENLSPFREPKMEKVLRP